MTRVWLSKMVEPYRAGEDIHVAVVGDGKVEEITPAIMYAKESPLDKDEIAICEDLMAYRWPLPNAIRCTKDERRTLGEIERNIIRYLRRYVWLRDERQYTLIADWVISTYWRDQFFYAPILIFDGLTVSGKSTAIYALQQIAYRGELFDSISAPAMAREVTDYKVTIFMDEILDAFGGDRGQDLLTMMKSSFYKEGAWIRADPKGRKNYRYDVYTHIAMSVKGDILPEDIHNRAIRINMTAAPPHIKLGDIYSWREDDSGYPESPDTIRTDLYRLKAASILNGHVLEDDGEPRSFRHYRAIANRDLATKMETGVWLYAHVNGLPDDSPPIRSRDRNIANTLYAVGLATVSGAKDTISVILENGLNQKEIIMDTPEALTFIAMLEILEERWAKVKAINPMMTWELFSDLVSQISTTDIARQYNEILFDQGNSGREPVATKTVTSKLAAMGFKYRRIGGHGYNKSWLDGSDQYFATLFLRHMQTFAGDRLPDYILINKRKPH